MVRSSILSRRRLPISLPLLALLVGILVGSMAPVLATAAEPPKPAATDSAAEPAKPTTHSVKPTKAKQTRAEREAEKKAVAARPQKYRDWLEEVDVLITPPEKTAFLALDKDYTRDAFIERFWESRDSYKGTSRNEFHDRWARLVAEARSHYGNLKEDRARILLLDGPPTVLLESNCSTILSPLEVWYYQRSDLVPFEFFIIFYQKWGTGPFRIWEPQDGFSELFSVTSEPNRRTLGDIATSCRDGDKIAGSINWVLRQGLDYGSIVVRFSSRPTGPGGEWLSIFNSYTTDLPADAKTFTAKLDFEYPGRYQNRTVMQGVMAVPASEVGQAKLAEHVSYNFILTGEVLQKGKLFDRFRYKFDFQPGDVQDGNLPLLFQRYLRPGAYDVLLRIEDLNSDRFFRSERHLDVPEADKIAPRPPSTDPVDIETAKILAEANAAIGTGETTLRIIPPHGDLQTGMLRIDTLSTGRDISQVTFSLDGKPILTKKRPPFSVELDLGGLPRTRRLAATAFDSTGAQVADDVVLLNAAGHRFDVRLVEPQKGKVYQNSLLARAVADVPEGETLERVEFYLNESLVATVYQPPYEQPIVLHKEEPLSYVRAVAYLTDGATTENLVFINTPDYPEEVEVQFVELYASVLDRAGRPVEGLTQKDFTPYEDGVKQQIARFDRVTDLPIHAAVAIDISASMEEALDQARNAALDFLQSTIKPKDRAAVITFNDRPNLAVKFTNDVTTLAGGLAGLKAERGTALYDSIVFSLYYFNGVKGQRAILLLSDGKDEGSRFTFDQALEYARRAGVTIYAIGLGDEVDKKKLAKIADETGGRLFSVKSAADLAGTYAEIERELRSQYLIAYQSSNPGTGNSPFRAVELKVSQPGLEAKTIRGYFP